MESFDPRDLESRIKSIEEQEWHDFMKDLGKVFVPEKGESTINPDALAEAAKKRVVGFFELGLDEADRVRVKVNPFTREAAIVIEPSSIFQAKMHVRLKDSVEYGIKFNIKF